jgi:hypothetical protein
MDEPISSSRVLRRLKALEILTNRSTHVLDMADLLRADGVFSQKEFEEIKVSSSRVEYLFKALEKAKKEERLDLLDYEWQLLPTQRIVLTIVSSSGIREFRHEEP